MKTLILIRHAKSDWPENTRDFDRPLESKGVDDAHKMAEFLLHEKIEIDQFITSSALRAKTTCAIFAEKYAQNYSESIELYHANPSQFENVILNIDDNLNTAALFSHNNGISNFANSLSEDNVYFKTCAVAIFKIHGESWSDFCSSKIKLTDYFIPKDLG